LYYPKRLNHKNIWRQTSYQSYKYVYFQFEMFNVCWCVHFLYRHLIASLNLAKFGQWKKRNKMRGAGHLASLLVS